MRKFLNKEVILWDFDGVLMDSMPIRDKGFEIVLNNFPSQQVEQLLAFHNENGGLSRYVKFRYFFEEIRGERVSDQTIQKWAERFSKIMRTELVAPQLLIKDSLDFVKENHQNYRMHVISGSDGQELNFICGELGIHSFFESIEGSPTPKKQLVKNLIERKKYSQESCLFIGDSKNDYEAAMENGIEFFGYNNPALKDLSSNYIENFCS